KIDTLMFVDQVTFIGQTIGLTLRSTKMYRCWETIPLEIRNQVASRKYEARDFSNAPYPVCKDGRCPFGVAILLMFPDTLPNSFKNPMTAVIADMLNLDRQDVILFTRDWDYGRITNLAEALGVSSQIQEESTNG